MFKHHILCVWLLTAGNWAAWGNPFDSLDRWLTGGSRTRQSHQESLCATQRPSADTKSCQSSSIVSGHGILHFCLLRDMSGVLTCVASVTEASCRYSELPHPYSCPSLDTARLQSPYVLICCTSTPARSPPTSTGLELTLWCPRPGRRGRTIHIYQTANSKINPQLFLLE